MEAVVALRNQTHSQGPEMARAARSHLSRPKARNSWCGLLRGIGRESKMTPAGLEPAIPGSVGRCLIHWATGPDAPCSICRVRGDCGTHACARAL